MGRTCTVCMRVFANRSKVLEHIHNKSLICRVNLKLRNDVQSAEAVEEADARQAEAEKAASLKGEHRAYAEALGSQACGPLQKVVIPIGHSRQCGGSRLMRRLLKCRIAAREVDFQQLQSVLGIGDEGVAGREDDEDVPLDVLGAAWRAEELGEHERMPSEPSDSDDEEDMSLLHLGARWSTEG